MTKKKRTLEDHLIEKIEESGYPLEIEISALLDKEYLVFNTQYYFDEELKQGRDIDIYAIPHVNIDVFTDEELRKKLDPFHLRTEIAVECKKSETHVWMFYTRPLIPPISRIYIQGQYRDKFSQTSTPSLVESLLFDRLILHYDEIKEAAIAYDEIKKKGNTKSRRGIFRGVNQLVKFIYYEIGTPKEPNISEKDFIILMFFPIIVFEGNMYRVTLESGNPIPQKVNHVLIRTNHRSLYTKEVNGFLVDVVHRSYFPEFMKKLNSDFLKITNVILQYHDEFLKKAEETKQIYEREKRAKRRYILTK